LSRGLQAVVIVTLTREDFVARLNISALKEHMRITREWAVKTRYQSLRLHSEKAPEEMQVQQSNLAAKAELEAWTAHVAYFQAFMEVNGDVKTEREKELEAVLLDRRRVADAITK
jgi:hypothetical protein